VNSLITTATAKGRRPYQEDTLINFDHPDGQLFGVFDGHGGEQCSDYLKEHFIGAFTTHYDGHKEPSRAMKQAFAQMQKETKMMEDGATGSVVWMPRAEGAKAVIAVIGDSPVVVGTEKDFHVSPDHNARSNKKEKEAAEKRGGCYSNGYMCVRFGGGGLQMTRAFGDRDMFFLKRTPQVYTKAVKDFILVATDGAFDPGHEETHGEIKKVVDGIREGSTAQDVVDRALAVPTHDNVTAVLWRRD